MLYSCSFIVLLLVTLSGCINVGTVSDTDNTGTGPDKVPANVRVLAEHEYVNHAWGYQHFGVVITSDGRVWAYEYQRGDTPWSWPEGRTVTAGELEVKHAHGRRELGRVGGDTLALMGRLIDNAARGTLTDRTPVGADMGSNERIAYQYIDGKQLYSVISLRANGDFDWHNTAPEAAQLADIIDAVVARFPR